MFCSIALSSAHWAQQKKVCGCQRHRKEKKKLKKQTLAIGFTQFFLHIDDKSGELVINFTTVGLNKSKNTFNFIA